LVRSFSLQQHPHPSTLEMASKPEASKPKAHAKKEVSKPKDGVKKEAPKKKVAPVPESLLKRRARKSRKLRVFKKDKDARVKKASVKTALITKKAEMYVKEYRKKQRQLLTLKRLARTSGNFYVPAEAKMALVVRVRGINGISPKPRKVLKLLRLFQLNNATFVRLNAATWALLKIAEPYIAFGYPSFKTVRDLIYKRGYGKVRGCRIPITNNDLIEKHLGGRGVICLEDIVHEIYTVGPHFKEVNKFLWPFKLSNPRGGWNRKTTHFNEGGDYGNREDLISDLVQRMN